MMINRRVVIVLSFVLSSCASQGPPIPNTAVVTTATPSSEALLSVTSTPQSTDINTVNTPNPGQGIAPTPISARDVSSSGAPTIDNNPALIIPDTGQSPISNKNKKKDKFQEFEIPVTGEDGSFLIPSTGFPPGVMTRTKINIPSYSHLITPMLEIPSLDLNIPIFGIAPNNGNWDVSWLWNQAGWLEGTAYPTANGNSVLTAHVVTADGKNGPFAYLKYLTSDDYVFIINSGYRYIYSVDSIDLVKPNDLSVFSHKNDSWLTLITCDSYDEKTKEYLLRVVVRAQLVEVQEIE